MSKEDRARLAAFGEHVRDEIATMQATEWIGRAVSDADPGPFPGAPRPWEAWRARDPEGFGEHLGGLVANARAHDERRREAEAEAAELAEHEAADRRARQVAAVAVALVLGAVVVVVIVRYRRRRRQRAAMMPEVRRVPAPPAPRPSSAPYFGLRLPGL